MKVLLIDDHPMVNYGLASCLEETGRFTVSGQAVSLAEARRFIQKARTLPSLVILDILLGEENGLDFVPFLQNHCKAKNIPAPPVLVCSVLEDPFRIQTALELGAAGYVSKAGNKRELLNAIETILCGEKYISGEHTVKINESSSVYNQFTKREMEIFSLIKQGKTNQQIAKTLKITVRTIENYISNIYFKTGKKTRLELVRL